MHETVVPRWAAVLPLLADEYCRQLETATQLFRVRRGVTIYLPGDPSDRIFLLRNGVIKIATRIPDGCEVILALLHPNDVFGELAIIDESPRDHAAEAYADCVIGAIGRDIILHMIHDVPEMGSQITRLIALRLRTFRSRIEELLCKSAHARVAHALLDLAEHHGVHDTDGILLPLSMSQGDLARLVGLRRETVNAILQEWRMQHLVEADRHSIRLRFPDRLREFVSRPAAAGTTTEGV